MVFLVESAILGSSGDEKAKLIEGVVPTGVRCDMMMTYILTRAISSIHLSITSCCTNAQATIKYLPGQGYGTMYLWYVWLGAGLTATDYHLINYHFFAREC